MAYVQTMQAATADSAGAQERTGMSGQAAHEDVVLSRTLGDFLTTAPRITQSSVPGFFSEVPPNLDAAVRLVAEENYTSGIQMLLSELEKTTDPRERARVQMWIGLAYGTQAIDYPSAGWSLGTSATAYLKPAISVAPEVIEAPDVARVMAEMIANGWAEEDPTAALDKYERKAEQSRRSIDFYFAGVISRRMSARAWSYTDTLQQDKRSIANFAKAVALNPVRYENWPSYLRGLMPVGMHDLATTEAYKMYAYFKPLRTPLLGDQGPASVFMQTASYRTMQDDERTIDEVQKLFPDAPYPLFERGMRAIETTPSDALKLFPDFIARVASGQIKLEPREQGYLPSAYYKLGFLQQQLGQVAAARETYAKLKQITPNYAEVDSNLAVVLAQLSEQETTGPKKLELLKEAVGYAADQEKHDFRGRASLKSAELRQRLRNTMRKVEEDIKAGRTAPAPSAAAVQTSGSR